MSKFLMKCGQAILRARRVSNFKMQRGARPIQPSGPNPMIPAHSPKPVLATRSRSLLILSCVIRPDRAVNFFRTQGVYRTLTPKRRKECKNPWSPVRERPTSTNRPIHNPAPVTRDKMLGRLRRAISLRPHTQTALGLRNAAAMASQASAVARSYRWHQTDAMGTPPRARQMA